MTFSEENQNDLIVAAVATLVDIHYSTGQPQLFTPMIEHANAVRAVTGEILVELNGARAAVVPDEVALARCAVLAASRMHSECCSRRAQRTFVCGRDVKFASDLTVFIASVALGRTLERSPAEMLGAALRKSSLPDIRLERASLAIDHALTPRALLRALPALVEGSPNLQINAPVSRVSRRHYLGDRVTAKAIARSISMRNMQVEVTSDWADPGDDIETLTDELVDGAIYRTSVMIIFVSGGRRGTGETLKLAEQLMIPVLALRRPSTRPLAARHRGHLGIREVRTYHSRAHAIRLAEDFVRRMRPQILKRHERLLLLAGRAPRLGEVRDAVLALEPARFESSLISRAGALFFSSDPVNWLQAPGETRNAILELIGADPQLQYQRTQPDRRVLIADDLERRVRAERRSFGYLLTAAEKEGWSYSVMATLWEDHDQKAPRNTAATHHRPLPESVNDWLARFKKLFGSRDG